MMKKLNVVLMVAAVLAMPVPAFATQYILCTGLNKYNTSYVGSSSFLNGCVPDAKNVYTNAALRGNWNAVGTNTLFLNARGTFAAVSNQLMSFASSAVSGDVVLYYHSSHGYQDSGKNTGICMYDKDMPDSSFAKILANFKSGVKVVIVLDTCHSGGMFKGIRRDGTERTLGLNGMDFAARVNEELAAIRADEVARGVKGTPRLAILECGWVTAADYNQYSWDGSEGGAFTDCYIGSCKSGNCDRSPYGNSDGYATMYEMFSYAVAQDETHGQGAVGTEDYTMPQCTNTAVLSAVTYGWVGQSEPAPATAPVFTSATTASVAVRGTLRHTLAATGGGITFALKSSTAPSTSYSFSDDTLTYTPASNSEAGTKTFTFTAANSIGTVTQTVSVTVSGAAPGKPANVRASATNAMSFTAAWDAATDATSYRLDVQTTSSSGGAQTTAISENFQGWTTQGSYGSHSQTTTAGTWSMTQAIVAPSATASGSGTKGRVQLKANAGYLTFPAVDGPSAVTVVAAGSSSGGVMELQKSLDSGSTWTTAASWDMETTPGTVTTNLNETANGVLLRLKASGRALYVHDITVMSGGGISYTGYVPGYENLTVSGTSQTVSGLTPGTTYGFVVRSYNSYGTSADSAMQTVTTAESDTAPVWSALPAQSCNAEALLTFDLKPYVSARPTAVITVKSAPAGAAGCYELADGVFSFMPPAGTSYTFTFTASNSLGTADATLTVTATATAPVFTSATSVSGTVGDMITFTATATGTPAPTVTLTSSSASTGDYEADGGYVVFQPTAVGTYTFTFTAANVAGSVQQTVTVTVTAAPVTVPTLTLGGLSSNRFTASWTACTGVSNYRLQVATDNQFSAGGNGASVTKFLNGATSPGSAPAGWTYDQLMTGVSYLFVTSASGYVESCEVDTRGLVSLTLTCRARTYGGTSGNHTTNVISFTTDGGVTWTSVGTVSASSKSMTAKSNDVSAAVGYESVRFRWTNPNATSGLGLGLDTLELVGTESAGDGSLVLDESVSATSYTVTGLTPNTPYFARVAGADAWSAVQSIMTAAGGSVTPANAYEQWLADQGLSPVDYPAGGSTNGMANWEAYIIDRAPGTGGLEVVPAAAGGTADDVVLSFSGSPNRYYELVVYTNLLSDPTTNDLGWGSSSMVITNPVGSDTWFGTVRVRLTAP